jgi:hypothetical protein
VSRRPFHDDESRFHQVLDNPLGGDPRDILVALNGRSRRTLRPQSGFLALTAHTGADLEGPAEGRQADVV